MGRFKLDEYRFLRLELRVNGLDQAQSGPRRQRSQIIELNSTGLRLCSEISAVLLRRHLCDNSPPTSSSISQLFFIRHT